MLHLLLKWGRKVRNKGLGDDTEPRVPGCACLAGLTPGAAPSLHCPCWELACTPGAQRGSLLWQFGQGEGVNHCPDTAPAMCFWRTWGNSIQGCPSSMSDLRCPPLAAVSATPNVHGHQSAQGLVSGHTTGRCFQPFSWCSPTVAWKAFTFH